MSLKPNTAYWFHNIDKAGARVKFVEGETEIYEGEPSSKNYCSVVVTDGDGGIITFKAHGETFKCRGARTDTTNATPS